MGEDEDEDGIEGLVTQQRMGTVKAITLNASPLRLQAQREGNVSTVRVDGAKSDNGAKASRRRWSFVAARVSSALIL